MGLYIRQCLECPYANIEWDSRVGLYALSWLWPPACFATILSKTATFTEKRSRSLTCCALLITRCQPKATYYHTTPDFRRHSRLSACVEYFAQQQEQQDARQQCCLGARFSIAFCVPQVFRKPGSNQCVDFVIGSCTKGKVAGPH